MLIKALKLFKRQVKLNALSKQEKLNELIRFSGINWTAEQTTQSNLELRKQSRKWPVKGNCRVCLTNKAYCYHHIVPLSRGGQNKMFNRIKICRECYKIVHPWL